MTRKDMPNQRIKKNLINQTSKNSARHRERHEVKRGDPVNSKCFDWIATSLEAPRNDVNKVFRGALDEINWRS